MIIRRSISLEEGIFNMIIENRGEKSVSRFINDILKEYFKNNLKGGKPNEKT